MSSSAYTISDHHYLSASSSPSSSPVPRERGASSTNPTSQRLKERQSQSYSRSSIDVDELVDEELVQELHECLAPWLRICGWLGLHHTLNGPLTSRQHTHGAVVTSLFVIVGLISVIVPFVKLLPSGDSIDVMQNISYACLVFIYAGALRLLRSSHDMMVAFSVLFDARHRVFLQSARIEFANRIRSRYMPLLNTLAFVFMMAACADSVATSWRVFRVQLKANAGEFSTATEV